MTETATIERTDADILEDIQQLIRSYHPLRMSRSRFSCNVRNGVVQVKGHIRSGFGRDMFLNQLPEIEGVLAVDDDELYDDETLRLQIGELLPPGVRMRINHGVVALTGQLPTDMTIDEVKARIGEIPGVKSITAELK